MRHGDDPARDGLTMSDNDHKWRPLRWWHRLNNTMNAFHDWMETSPTATVPLAVIIWCLSVVDVIALFMITPADPHKRRVILGGFAIWTFLALPSLIRYRLKQQRDQAIEARRRNGCCPSCGYDLRASPDRCPECGAEPPAEKKTWD
jgi:hypothetical protein